MAKRFYCCPVVYLSIDPNDPEDKSYRPLADKYLVGNPGTSSVAAMTSDPTAVDAWALVKVDVPDHTAAMLDAAMDVLPDLPLDGRPSRDGDRI